MVNETTRIVTVRSMTLIFLYFLHSNAKPTRDNDFGKFYLQSFGVHGIIIIKYLCEIMRLWFS